MFWNRRTRIRPAELATILMDEFVCHPLPGLRENVNQQLDTASGTVSGQQLQLYQFAAVMLAILDAERRDTSFVSVRKCMERHFLALPVAEGVEPRMNENLRFAMNDLIELIQPEGRPQPVLWAHNWMLRIGIHESNPARLSMFTLRWPTSYAELVKFLKKIQPIA